mmetsp:Transcript_42014/g.111959  ORF Transcript_42014/g.111959 Transcript_42014/m.111959 type:complete len:207 (-) Transcript_42014:2711-3331(-)
MSTGSTCELRISRRYDSSPEMRKKASEHSRSDAGSPSVHICLRTETAPASTAAACESLNESRLHAVLPQIDWVMRSVERVRLKMFMSVARLISFERPYSSAESRQKISAQTRSSFSSSFLGGSGFLESALAAWTRSSFTSFSRFSGVSRLSSALAQTCLVNWLPARSIQIIIRVYAPPCSTIRFSLPMWQPRLHRALAQYSWFSSE